jgi:hypothetical protein
MLKRISSGVATVALLGALALPARAADVQVGINVTVPPPPPVVFQSPPQLVAVPEAPQVMYAPSAPVGFFSYGGQYYRYHEGHWFVAGAVGGPWTYVERGHVPHQVLAVPTHYYYGHIRHAKYHEKDHHHGHGHHDQDHDDWHEHHD